MKLENIFENLALTVKDTVNRGMKQVLSKVEPEIARLNDNIKSLEERCDKSISEISALKKKPDSVTIDVINETIENTLNEKFSELKNSIVIPEPPKAEEVDYDKIKDFINLRIDEAIKMVKPIKGDKGEDGAPAIVDYDKIKEIIDVNISKAVEDIEIPEPINGTNGEDGRDALHLEILPTIDEAKEYPRNTYATFKGGLWRSYETTKGMRGWECIVNGLEKVDVEYDGERSASIKTYMSNGEYKISEITIPAMLHKGIWQENTTYHKGDNVQLSGAMWLAIEETSERPGGDSKSWIIAAKRGGTGDSAYDIARKAGFIGDKKEWLDSLGKKTRVKAQS